MTRLLLPFSMGTVVGVNPMTYEEQIEHPVLHIGSCSANVKQSIWDWLKEQYSDGECRVGFDGSEYYIDFPSEADVTWFKLRWLS